MGRSIAITLIVMLFVGSAAWADTTTVLDFEGFLDSTAITTQNAGLTFTNATVLTAGIGLDESEFPPFSGVNALFDDSGPISITFSTPVTTVAGYFTYFSQLTLQAFDGSGNLLGFVVSAFNSNAGLSGDPGSSPNELLSLSFASGISSVTMTGDPGGSSFTVDNLTITTASAVPEPSTLVLLIGGLLLGTRKRSFWK
jgi:hypothetical protein